MKLRNIEIIEKEANIKGDLFCKLMGDLFHSLGYDEPRFNIHKTGREIDLSSSHRTEKRIAIAECKAQEDKVGGADINKFVGVLDAEKRRIKKLKMYSNYEAVGYFISLSGFNESSIEQECEFDDERCILLRPQKIVEELVQGRIIVPIEKAVTGIAPDLFELADYVDLLACKHGWIWVIYLGNTQKVTHFTFIHAEGKPLIKELADDVIENDKANKGIFTRLNYIYPHADTNISCAKIEDVKAEYFKYLENECGEIQFEGLPTDKDAGSVKVMLENIFVPLHLEPLDERDNERESFAEEEKQARISIGDILKSSNKLAILAKPGGGKSTLIKRLAIAYAYPSRLKLVNDGLPENEWFPIFIRCRELGEKVTSSITDIINNIPNRAEIGYYTSEFARLISDVLQKGNALLLIDGLDEIAEDKNRIMFVNQLRTFLATYPRINIIVTSREAGFRVVGGSLANYCSHHKISKLNETEIVDLTIRWHKAIVDNSEKTIKDAKSLSSLILKDNRIRVLAENPLLLTTLLFVKRWAGYLPTKKSILYQEMIKLLLVTWNVEGHEQLDIDEAEPQLAFVAYWMTFRGQQTISYDELKECLLLSRNQMPDILGYTKISVPDFIKRVESRSSLLIMSGHIKNPDGQVKQLYEFLHLSFQEYLTAKAIVERYLPRKDAKKTILSLLKPHTEKEGWKEVFPLVAVLSKRDTKELIEYLIEESSKNVGVNEGPRSRRRISPPEILGNCIANEIQITPELLEKALEWYAKSHLEIRDIGTREVILNSKFGVLFREKVRSCFFSKYEDKYIASLGALLGELFLYDLNLNDYTSKIAAVKEKLHSGNKEDACTGIMALMEIAYEFDKPVNKDIRSGLEPLQELYDLLYIFMSSNDNHFYFTACWCLAWLANVYSMSDEYRLRFATLLINGWLNNNMYNICRVSSWALGVIMRPTIDIAPVIDKIPNFKEKTFDKYNKPLNQFDKKTALLITSHFNQDWCKQHLEILLSDKKQVLRDNAIPYYVAKYGLELPKTRR